MMPEREAAATPVATGTLTAMTTTPRELEDELDVSARTIRAFLREQYPDHESGARWVLDDDQATVVRARFSD